MKATLVGSKYHLRNYGTGPKIKRGKFYNSHMASVQPNPNHSVFTSKM